MFCVYLVMDYNVAESENSFEISALLLCWKDAKKPVPGFSCTELPKLLSVAAEKSKLETNNGTTAVEMFSRHHAMWLIDHTRSINRSVSFHLSKKQKVLFGLNRVNTDKNREHSALEMCVSVTQVHTHTPAACPPHFFSNTGECGGDYYSTAVINIRRTFSGMQRQWCGLVTDGGGHYISLALVYLSLLPQDTNNPCCLQWTIQHRSTRIENRYCASHLCYWHSWIPEGRNKPPTAI